MKAFLAATFALAGALLAAAQLPPPPEAAILSIPLLPPGEMPDFDRRRAADSQPEIARSALVYGYTLDSSFDYKEISCPLAPKDILLSYEGAQPNRPVSRFTAILHRHTEAAASHRHAEVQIIPITLYGAVPFLPASSNPHTFELFNRVVTVAPVGKELAKDANHDPLLLRSLCYLAMIGETPPALRTPALDPPTIHAPVPTLGFAEKGIAREVLSARNHSDTYQVWTLTFGGNGKLLTAERLEHPIDRTAPILNAADAPSPSATSAPGAVHPTATTASVDATAPPTVAAAPVLPTPARTPMARPSAPSAPSAPSMPVAAAPTTVAAAKSPLAAKVVPQPPHSLLSNLPPPPSRIIPASAMPYPPQAPEK